MLDMRIILNSQEEETPILSTDLTRVSEIVGAIGLVQLQKLNKVVKNNAKRYKIYESIINKYPEVSLRRVPKKNIPLKDCLIFNFSNKNLANKFLKEMIKAKLPTKNIPDALMVL